MDSDVAVLSDTFPKSVSTLLISPYIVEAEPASVDAPRVDEIPVTVVNIVAISELLATLDTALFTSAILPNNESTDDVSLAVPIKLLSALTVVKIDATLSTSVWA